MVPGQRQCSGIAVTLLVLWRFGLTRPQMQLFTSVALGAALVVTALVLVFRPRIVAWFARTPARNPRFSTCSGLVCVRHELSAGGNGIRTRGPAANPLLVSTGKQSDRMHRSFAFLGAAVALSVTRPAQTLGPLSNPTTAAQCWRWEPLFMPLRRPSRSCSEDGCAVHED